MFLNVVEFIFGVFIEFDVNSFFLLVSILQLYVQWYLCGYVDFFFWDDGVIVLFFNYQVNFMCNINFGQNSDYCYLGLCNGFNLFGWCLCNDFFLSGGIGMCNKFSSNCIYVECDICVLKGILFFGELYIFVQGDVFESVCMCGV